MAHPGSPTVLHSYTALSEQLLQEVCTDGIVEDSTGSCHSICSGFLAVTHANIQVSAIKACS